MATISIPYSFSAGQTIVAAQHNDNNTAIANFVNALSAGTNFNAGAIGTATINDLAVTSDKLAGSAVITTKINDGAVTTAKLDQTAASQAVSTATIRDAAVTTIKIADGAVTSAKLGPTTINGKTDSYTLVLTDANNMIEINKSTFTTLTVPTEASVNFPVGTTISVMQVGAGQVRVAGAGVTFRSSTGTKTRVQWSVLTLYKKATNEWVVFGDTTTADV